MPSVLEREATPQTSAIASSAPTSWKWTSSADAVDAGLGLGERGERLVRARARARGQRRASISARIARQSRWRARRARRDLGTARARCRGARRASTRSDEPSTPSRDEARRDGAWRGAGVEQRAEQHVAGDAATQSM